MMENFIFLNKMILSDLTIKSPSAINLQSGHTLTLTASYYTSNQDDVKIRWFRNGEVVLPSDGYKIWS